MCPDQNEWLDHLAGKHRPNPSAKASVLFDMVGYDGPAELFSMCLCLILEKCNCKLKAMWI
jgi:hypothetical protein